MDVHDLSQDAVGKMPCSDLSELTAPPESPIGEFDFNDAICGVSCFVGKPPWECHPSGDELLHVLGGQTELTTAEGSGLRTQTLGAGSLTIVPSGIWHRNTAAEGVTILYITPSEGNLHSSAEGDPRR